MRQQLVAVPCTPLALHIGSHLVPKFRQLPIHNHRNARCPLSPPCRAVQIRGANQILPAACAALVNSAKTQTTAAPNGCAARCICCCCCRSLLAVQPLPLAPCRTKLHRPDRAPSRCFALSQGTCGTGSKYCDPTICVSGPCWAPATPSPTPDSSPAPLPSPPVDPAAAGKLCAS